MQKLAQDLTRLLDLIMTVSHVSRIHLRGVWQWTFTVSCGEA